MTDSDHREIITRKQARELGLKKYFTGVSCIYGHIAERFSVNGVCDICAIEIRKKCYKKMKLLDGDRYRGYARKSYSLNKEQRQELSRQYRKKNGENKLGRKKWVAANKDKIAKWNKKYHKLHPEVNRAIQHTRRMRKKQGGGSHTGKQIKSMLIAQKKLCNERSCKKNIANKYHIDHVIPLKIGGSNSIENIQLLCPQCNLRKGAKDPFQWAKENGRLL